MNMDFKTAAQIWEDTPYEVRLACACYVLNKVTSLIEGGGSFHYLIYDLLGFGPDAYIPLFKAGGLTISNLISEDL